MKPPATTDGHKGDDDFEDNEEDGRGRGKDDETIVCWCLLLLPASPAPRVMVVLQFYRDYEVFFVVVVVGGGVGGGVLHSTWTCRCSEHFCYCVDSRTYESKIFDIVSFSHFLLK